MQSVLFSSKKSTYFLTGPHVGFDFVEKNKEGEGVLEFAESLDLADVTYYYRENPVT